jgi:hypothetical protein
LIKPAEIRAIDGEFLASSRMQATSSSIPNGLLNGWSALPSWSGARM